MVSTDIVESKVCVKGLVNPFAPAFYAAEVQAGRKLDVVVEEYIRHVALCRGEPVHITSRLFKYCTVFVNNISVPREEWHDYIIYYSDSVVCNIMPLGGGSSGGKNPLATVLTLAVLAGALYVSGGIAAAGLPGVAEGAFFAAGSQSAQLLGAVAAAAITTVGTLAIKALCPVTPADTNADESSSVYTISGGRNEAKPWQSLPVVLGTHKTAPPFAVQPYTATNNNENSQQWFAVFLWSYATQGLVMDLKIGDTALNILSYDSVYPDSYVLTAGKTLNVYKDNRNETNVGVELRKDQWITRTIDVSPVNESAPGRMRLEVDIYFPGLYRSRKSGGIDFTTVYLEVQYRLNGAIDWINSINITTVGLTRLSIVDTLPGIVNISRYVALDITTNNFVLGQFNNFTSGGEWDSSKYALLYRIFIPNPTADEPIFQIAEDNRAAIGATGLDIAVSYYRPSAQLYATLTAGQISTPTISVTGKDTKMLSYTFFTPDLTEGIYDVRVKRVTDDSDNPLELQNQSFLRTLRSVRFSNPLSFKYPVYITELRVNANEELNGAVDTLTGVFQNHIPDWNGSTWVTRATSNPASIIRYILTGDANERRVGTNMIDNAAFVAFWIHCNAEGFEYNKVVDAAQDVMELCAEVAAAGRGFIVQPNGVFSIVYDSVKDAPVQHFTPANSWGFSSSRRFMELPHAFRVAFINEENDWLTDEYIVYDDGYGAHNASLYENIRIPGVTKPDLIYKHAREYIKTARLRPEIHTLEVDMEYLIAGRRDLVRVSHDVLLIGLAYGRIKKVITTGGAITGVEIEQTTYMAPDRTYGLSIRTNNQSGGKPVMLDVQVNTIEGEQYTLTFTTPQSLNTIQAGNLYTLGEFGKTTEDYIISHIEPGEGLNATITLINYAPEIYDTGTAPPFNPNTSSEYIPARQIPARPEHLITIDRVELRGNEAVSITAVSWLPPVSTPVPIDTYQLSYRYVGAANWQGMTFYPTREAQLNLAEGYYDFRVRSVSQYGQVSDWLIAEDVFTYGDRLPPDDVTGLVTFYADARLRLRWNPVEDFRPLTYEVRFGPSWLEGQVVQNIDSIECPLLIDGTYWVKARTRSGVYSINPAWVTVTGSAGLQENVIASWEEAPDWGGTKENFYIGGIAGAIRLDGVDERGVYTIPESRIITLAAIAEAGVYIDYTALAYKSTDVYAIEDMYEVEDIYGAIDAGWNVTVEINTQDANDEWSRWQQLNAGHYLAKAFNFRLTGELTDRDIFMVVYNFRYTVDVPDRLETLANQPITSAGFTWVFDPPFNNPPEAPQSVVGTVVQQTDDDRQKKVIIGENISPEQVTIYITNENGTPVSGMANLYAQGY